MPLGRGVISWNYRDFYGILWSFVEFHGVSGTYPIFNYIATILQDSVEFCGIPRLQGIPWNHRWWSVK
jgi:hypothetical protein